MLPIQAAPVTVAYIQLETEGQLTVEFTPAGVDLGYTNPRSGADYTFPLGQVECEELEQALRRARHRLVAPLKSRG